MVYARAMNIRLRGDKMHRVPGFLHNYLEKTGGGYNEYLIFRMQLATIFTYIIALLAAIRFHWILLAVVAILFLLNLYTLFYEMRKIRDSSAYIYFFGGLNILAFLLALSKFFIRGLDFNFIFGYLILFIIFLVGYFFKFSRDYTYGKVILADEEWAAVQIPFDICSGIRNGYYVVKSHKGIKPGKDVKIELAKTFFERRPWRIFG